MSTMNILTDIAADWAIRCFGAAHVNDPAVRVLRFAEEAVELAQSLDISKDQMHKLIDIVYSRPKGNVMQEMGGSIMTLVILNRLVTRLSIEDVLKEELLRVLSKNPVDFTKRNQHKIDLGLDGKCQS